jgi:uncharacterized iron-regulated membrane protein
MRALRTAVFWLHLAAGVIAGLVILVMSATGAVLAFKPQILNGVDRRVRFVEPAGTPLLGPSQTLAAVRAQRPDVHPATLVLDRDPAASAAVGLGRDGTIYVNPYTGAVLGEGSPGAQGFFRSVENWHRWLGLAGNRELGRALTGASNLAFFALAVSGLFLWWPHQWLPQHLNTILFFRRAKTARARDFNWHNVIGFWCAPVLIVLTATGVVMSYPWANRLLYQAAGSPVPVVRGGGRGGPAGATAETRRPGGTRAGRGEGTRESRQTAPVDLDRLFARAEQQMPSWRTMTWRLPEQPRAPVSITMSDVRSWNPFARSQLTLDAVTGDVVSWEPYADSSRGQKWRGWVRFGHTGELGGLAGQSLAGIASLGGVMLVWTGLALAIRRLAGWRLWRRLGRSRRVAAAPSADLLPE